MQVIERFIARVGVLGAIVIVVFAVIAIGVAGGAVEHFRLAAQQEQGSQSGSQDESTQGGETNSGSKQEDKSGTQDQTQQGDSSGDSGSHGQQSAALVVL